jgi:hypothetical protein
MAKLNLSPELIDGLLEVLGRHDPATRDPIAAMQYFAAVNGFILAHHDMTEDERRDYLDNLNALAKHVLADVEEQMDAPETAPVAPQDAFGVWKPGDK